MNIKLKECTEQITKGTTPTSIGGNFTKEGVNFLKVEGISSSGQFIKKKFKFIDKITHENLLKRSQIKEFDILYSIAGTIGRTAIATKDILPCNTNQALAIIRPDLKKIDPYFLLYCLKDKKRLDKTLSNVVQSVQSNLSLSVLKEIEIPKFDLNYQKKISEILLTLDNKISINHQINKNLDNIASALFKSWFINFDPVRAKIEKITIGLSKEIIELFPNSLESKEGKIPQGWKFTTLNEITSKFSTGLNPRKNFKLGSGENFYVTIKNLGDLEINLDEKCDKIDDDAILKINKRSKLKKNDILFSGIGTIGKVVFIHDEPKNWNISESLFSLRANEKLTNSSFLYYLLKSYPLQNYVKKLASGSVQRGIRMSSLKNYQFPLSNLNIQQKFNEITFPMIKKISKNLQEIRNLNLIRDLLLPKLISGELVVREEKKFIDKKM